MSAAEHITTASRCQTRAGFSAVPLPFGVFAALGLGLSLSALATFVISLEKVSVIAVLVSILFFINALWMSGGAATAILGLFSKRPALPNPEDTWQPNGQTAILITVCGEAPEPIADYLSGFVTGLKNTGLHTHAEVFVISDTYKQDDILREQAAFSDLIRAGAITYRRRDLNTDKKPGNIADWLEANGDRFEYMLVKDADSRMTARAVRTMIWRLEQHPNTGLLQAGIALIPGRTRFGKHQRIASRLLSPNFGRGFAAWSGNTANYWGHNAIMRVKAFRSAVPLPRLLGRAPLGGAILSHDFVEAAWIRRAGWDIELAPDISGSAEDAPQTLDEFFLRDRRWCQGNLQHLRIIGQPGLHGLSRLHFLTGILSYLAGPIWMLLVMTLGLGGVSVTGYATLILVAAILLTPKICALIDILPTVGTWRRRRVVLKAWLAELVVSTLVAPLILMRHAASVFSVLMGRDCGWKSNRGVKWQIPSGWAECGIGLALLAASTLSRQMDILWLLPIILPLLSAPVLIPVLNGNAS